jgi:crotonobetaine/carnitine-CoA ligase
VTRGSNVAILLPNGPDFLRAWWGIATLGAVMVGLNVAWKGTMLRQALDVTEPVIVISTGDFAQRIVDASPDQAIVDSSELAVGGPAAPKLDAPIEPWDIHHIQFTSGTTGMSKASRTSYLHFFLTGSWATLDMGLDEQDTYLIDLPLFHQAALCMLLCCLNTGSKIVVRSLPAMRDYWEVARDTGATVSFLLSSMTPFLMSQSPRAAEREHKLRLMVSAPLPADVESFQQRFGIAEVVTAYGSTETSGPIIRIPPTPQVAGSCGRPRPGYDIRLVDEHDCWVPDGTPGELIVRSELPWALSCGYVKDPAGTAEAWRNGWFHTGDLMVRDDEGNLFFVDRTTDALRRRGENISSFEVEREILEHEAISEVACVAVPSDDVDDEVKVFLVLHEGQQLEMAELVRFLVDRMPHYMVPRYYEAISAFPKTESMKIKKHLLREQGNSEGTWDCVAHGFRVTRTGLVEKANAVG